MSALRQWFPPLLVCKDHDVAAWLPKSGFRKTSAAGSTDISLGVAGFRDGSIAPLGASAQDGLSYQRNPSVLVVANFN
jgi:hypothetical protein